MSKRLYVAYGSNLNFRQMRYRCPTAKLYGIGTVDNYELQFKGRPNGAYATIAPKEGSSVPVAVWEIKGQDERSLDRYEGYPSHYFKKDIPVQLNGKEVSAMVYIMNLKMDFGMPSPGYYQTVYEGYNNCNLDTEILNQAVKESAQNFYSSVVGAYPESSLFDYSEDDVINDDEYDDTEYENESDDIDPDITDPFYYSDGMHY